MEISLQQLWQAMDAAWDALGLDARNPDPARLAEFYRDPVWLLNGVFSEQDAESRGHRSAIVAWLQAQPPGAVLDYGGGYGALARMVAAAMPARPVAVYEPFPSQAALARAAAFANLRYVQKLGSNYSYVLCLDVLEHLTNPLTALLELAAALRPGGQLVIANNFYPLIKCHLPGTFHLRYSFALMARLAGLRRLGLLPGSHAVLYQRVGRRAPWAALRLAEQLSRAVYPLLRTAHRAYRRLRGRSALPL